MVAKTSKKTKSSKDKEKILMSQYLEESEDKRLVDCAYLYAGIHDEYLSEKMGITLYPTRTREELDTIVKKYKDELNKEVNNVK